MRRTPFVGSAARWPTRSSAGSRAGPPTASSTRTVPSEFARFTDEVLPILRERGLVRSEYESATPARQPRPAVPENVHTSARAAAAREEQRVASQSALRALKGCRAAALLRPASACNRSPQAIDDALRCALRAARIGSASRAPSSPASPSIQRTIRPRLEQDHCRAAGAPRSGAHDGRKGLRPWRARTGATRHSR